MTDQRQPRRGRGALITLAGIVVGIVLVAGTIAVIAFVGGGGRDGAAPPGDPFPPGGPLPGTTGPGATGPTGTAAPGGNASAPPSASASIVSPPGQPAPPGAIVVPDVQGFSAAAATDDLRRVGLTQVQLVSEYADGRPVDDPPKWTVVRQSVAPGSGVLPGSTIVLTCIRGY